MINQHHLIPAQNNAVKIDKYSKMCTCDRFLHILPPPPNPHKLLSPNTQLENFKLFLGFFKVLKLFFFFLVVVVVVIF